MFLSYRSLTLHRRSCHIVNSSGNLSDLFVEVNNPNLNVAGEVLTEMPSAIFPSQKPSLLVGVKLPRSKSEWDRANEYFRMQIGTSRELGNLNMEIDHLNRTMWAYFSANYGQVKARNEFNYNMSKSKLKKCLRNLKLQNGKLEEIKYVSRLLRKKLRSHVQRNYEEELSKDFWKFCKKEFEESETQEPNFDESSCYDYFRNIFFEKHKNRTFNLPSWLKPFPVASSNFDLECPTYQEITKIIRKMKSSGSPCPIDQISIIPFKRCPILRTQLWRLLSKCWTEKYIPTIWKRAVAVLIYKKDSPDNPANFRPIVLEPVMLKVFTSAIRNKIFKFVRDNKYIETNIQKGFWPGLSGTVEHTELLNYLLNHARNKQRSIIVTLIDLKNAFGEVHHNLLKSILKSHHIPDEITGMIENLYTDYGISILTNNFITTPISVERGVLQGDCLSPLLFNLCVNSLINTINDERIQCLGYVNDISLNPRHWFQFADDAAIISAHNEDNQLLCNAFSKWSSWADLYIRVNKCHTFGIKKFGTKAVQYKPTIKISGQHVPQSRTVKVLCI